MVTTTASNLFQPIQLGKHILKHRVVLAPLTRLRNDEQGVPTELSIQYYEQRATEGGLLISEGVGTSPYAGVYKFAPVIHSKEQIEAWKKINQAVHKKGSITSIQIFHNGRAAFVKDVPDQDPTNIISASDIPIQGNSFLGIPYEKPRSVTTDEIQSSLIQEFVDAAKNAILAGFDIIEIHAANGYLLHQFISSSSNQRTDQYGGSIENRSRLVLEIVDEVSKAIGDERVGIRFSPYNDFQDMFDDQTLAIYSYLTHQLQTHHPHLAYLHFIEPHIDLTEENSQNHPHPLNKNELSLQPFRDIWKGPFIVAGNYTYDYNRAYEVAEKSSNTLVAFGRSFIANPDLVYRIQNHLPLNKYNRSTFYVPGSPKGYTDYPFYDELKN
ncbi:unnamed protein product [Cunninghamella blakesleeana]